MSRIYFHSPSRTAELRGSERAWLGGLVTDMALGLLDLQSPSRIDRLRSLIHPGHYMAKRDTASPGWVNGWAASYSTAFSVGWSESTPLIQYEGEPVDAGIYRRGFPQKISSDSDETVWSDQGWDDVIALMRERDDEPVVTSYSVCDGFPDSSVGDWMPPWPEGVVRDWRELSEEQRNARSQRSDEWYDLDDAEQWRISMAGLRASEEGLEMKPDNWDRFRFGHRLSVLDLFVADSEERLRTGLGIESVA
jgi:hypothetical protein